MLMLPFQEKPLGLTLIDRSENGNESKASSINT